MSKQLNQVNRTTESLLLYPWLDIDRETFLCMEPCSLGRSFVFDECQGDMFKAWTTMHGHAEYMLWLISHCPGSVFAEQVRHIALEFVMQFLAYYTSMAKEYPVTTTVQVVKPDGSGEFDEWLPTSEQAESYVRAAFNAMTNYENPTLPYDEYTYHISTTDCVYNTCGWRDAYTAGEYKERTPEMKRARRALGILRSALRLYRSLSCNTIPNDAVPVQSPERYVYNITDQLIDACYIVGHEKEESYQHGWCDMIRRIATPNIAGGGDIISQHDEESE